MKNLTKKQIDFLNKYVSGSWKYNPATGLVDVDGNFKCSDYNINSYLFLHKTLLGIKFGKVSGDFNCSYNSLTSLEGAPLEVGGSFWCEYNNLTSLKGAPLEVGGRFDCRENYLTSLVGGPQKVGEHFDCRDNKLTSLVGAPQKVGWDFYCTNDELIDLNGAPLEVGGSFKTPDFSIRGNSSEYVIEDLNYRFRLKSLGLD